METVLIVTLSFVLYIFAYNTYGRYLSRCIFKVDPNRRTPACEINDGVDFVPSRKSLVFGHHFTSIAGTGPIVGPAIAVVWGWVPALIWVFLGSIFMGAVHDFGALMISMRHRGRTIADLSGDVINKRVRLLFMIVVVIGLWIVLAIFGLVIATIFKLYETSIMPVFLQIPIAIGLGVWLKKGLPMLLGSILAVGLMYTSIWWYATNASSWQFPSFMTDHLSVVGIWTVILMIYVFIASVLPVDVLLQPRDYINSWQLLIAMGLLVLGVFIAQPPIVADAVRFVPEVSSKGNPAPPMVPFLFITIACGAVSGFHCLVSSGCSSRQLKTESDAQYIGYGAMLTEGFLAILVIIACVAGIGMTNNGQEGHAIWMQYYQQWGGDKGLGSKLEPFINGSANMIAAVGIPLHIAMTLMGVFVASFAATTLDSATRLQRYVISELAGGGEITADQLCFQCGYALDGLPHPAHCPECGLHMPKQPPKLQTPIRSLFTNRFGATFVAVASALVFALSDGIKLVWQPAGMMPNGSGRWREIGGLWSDSRSLWYHVGFDQAGLGGLKLWPIFGATNQLLASLALMVITVWLVKSKRPAWISAIPMTLMLIITAYAIFLLAEGFGSSGNWFLMGISVFMLVLQAWILIEAAILVGSKRSAMS
jgi:carbon starvation protein